MKSRLYAWLSIILSGIIIITSSASTFALSDQILDEFNANGISWYNPQGYLNCIIGPGGYDGTTSAGLNGSNASFIDTYHDIAAQLSVEYGIPWETVVAQGILESRSGTSRFAVERNNFFGIGAFDSNPDNAYSYETPEAGWRGYFANIARTSTYRNHGVFQNGYTISFTPKPNGNSRTTRDNITNPYDYLQTIWDAGYATDSSYYQKISPIITSIINRAHEKGWATSEELASTHPEMLANAASHAAGNSPATGSGSTSYTGSACITIGGEGGGSINQVALSFAWPEKGVHGPDDPKPEYLNALQQIGVYNNSGLSNLERSGASCDIFVAAVMRASGADPNYPLYRSEQVTYLRQNSSYMNLGSSISTENIQPGDIRINGTHTELVVQLSDGSLAIASASHEDRTAEIGNFYNDSSYTVYRHI